MKVKVHYLFGKSDKIGSKLIAYFTQKLTKLSDAPSHVAILINERWVLESTISHGVSIIPYKKWLKTYAEVAKIPSRKSQYEYSQVKQIFKSIKNKKYDWLGLIYVGYRIGLNIYFKCPIPSTNKLQDPNKYFCCEAVGKMTEHDYSMKSPAELMELLNG